MKHQYGTICIGSIFALTAVALGAFGAHALKGILIEQGTLETWKTAVDYQMWHALSLVVLAMLQKNDYAARTGFTRNCFCLGIFLFSGSLYALSLGGPNWLGPVTPIGGLCFMAGWAHLAWRSFRSSINASDE